MSDHRLMPVEPTPEMLSSAMAVCTGFSGDYGMHNDHLSEDAAREVYQAFRSTAPAVQGEPVEFDYPDFHEQGMGCGLEDRNITDRYEAMRYGWDEALERVAENIGSLGPLYTFPQPTEQQPAPDVAVPTPEMIEAGANAVMITDSASECAEKVYRAMRAAAPQPAPGSFDFLAHLRRQREWSERTFGPGQSTARIIDHITKELREVAAAPDDVTEWIDVAILALDGAWRCGASPEQIQAALVAKHKKNEARQWPDWRTMPADKAIEHSHTGEASTACCGDPGDCWEPCGDLGKSEAHVRVSDHSPDDWVPISERLPELNQPVVLININGFENVGGDWERHIQDAGYLAAWGDGRECKYWSVRGARAIELSSYTHWLPLPAAPVTDGEGQ